MTERANSSGTLLDGMAGVAFGDISQLNVREKRKRELQQLIQVIWRYIGSGFLLSSYRFIWVMEIGIVFWGGAKPLPRRAKTVWKLCGESWAMFLGMVCLCIQFLVPYHLHIVLGSFHSFDLLPIYMGFGEMLFLTNRFTTWHGLIAS